MAKPSTVKSTSIHVEVVFAQDDWVWHKTLCVPAGTTALQAFRQSGFAQAFPEKIMAVTAMGVFGQRCREDHPLQEGDRLELYRSLKFDPKESRRRRAMHKKRVKHGSSIV